jgi:hypothetical protein
LGSQENRNGSSARLQRSGAPSRTCATYKMDMEVVIDGTAVNGRIKQQGRPDRNFNATLAAGGMLKTM